MKNKIDQIIVKTLCFTIALFSLQGCLANEAQKDAPQDVTASATRIEGMVFVKGGCFQMGDTFGEGDEDERPIHEVCLDDFYIGRYEVTQEEWKKVFSYNPLKFNNCGDCPVERLSWNDTQEFIKALNAKTGRKYSLPTEAQWEYAARERGRKVRFATGKDTISPDEANFDSNKEFKEAYSSSGKYRGKTMPVGSFPPNSLGLYDMSGNALEWVNDWYGEDYYGLSSRNNPKGPSSGSYRVLRGGAWFKRAKYVRASSRNRFSPSRRPEYLGFRLVLESPSKD